MWVVMQGNLCDSLLEHARLLSSVVASILLESHLIQLVFVLGSTVDNRILGTGPRASSPAGMVCDSLPVRVYAAGPATEWRPQNIFHGWNASTYLE
jgi:hypothetical protein